MLYEPCSELCRLGLLIESGIEARIYGHLAHKVLGEVLVCHAVGPLYEEIDCLDHHIEDVDFDPLT